MATRDKRKKDDKNRVLKTGETQCKGGGYRFTWYDKTGQRHYKYSSDLDKLREFEKTVVRDTVDGIINTSLTVNDMYERWKSVKRGLRGNTFANYIYMYDSFVKPKFGLTKLDVLKKTDVRAFYIYLKENLNLKTNTIDSIHTVLHQVLDIAVEDEYLRNNPSDNALTELKRAYTDDKKDVRALTHPEQDLFEEFLNKTEEHRVWKPIFITMLYTGLRVGEASALKMLFILLFCNGRI